MATAALLGSLAPDLSLYLMAGWALYVQAIAAEVVFGQLYFSAAWQDVFAIDNSIPLWTLALTAALALRWPVATAFTGAGLLHLALDLPLHNEDARQHFWPLSDWVFRSPFSYWDQSRHAGVIGPLEIAACLALSILLWRRFRSRLARVLIVLALIAEATPGLMFALILD